MKLSKKIITMIIVSMVIIGVGSVAIGCTDLFPTAETAAAEGEQVAGEEEQPAGIAGMFSSYGTWIWLAVLGVAFYFLLIRPQRQRTKKAQDLASSLQRGDEVITVGGFHGRIKDIRDDSIIITIASGVDVKVSKSSVSKKVSQQ
jgi:preprotein translocase subunit YajC